MNSYTRCVSSTRTFHCLIHPSPIPFPPHTQLYGIILLPVSLLFALYALNTYISRSSKIRTREPTRWDDPIGPVLLGSVFTAALIAQFFIKVACCIGALCCGPHYRWHRERQQGNV